MGTRIKTFDSTGVAPNGRLYAGDLNAIQDAFADLLNLAQTVGVGSLQVGESGLQLLRYGSGEARISGALRTDGIIRALSGLYAGGFTTTQRDAIAAGSRPYGLVILNTTTNRLEFNAGTDASPNWQPVGPSAVEVPIGGMLDWPWAAASLPAWALLPFGQSVLKASYPALDAIASAAGYLYGTDPTHFSLPDYRGRVGVGKDDMGGTAANRITAAITGVAGTALGAVFGAEGITLTTAQLPAHNHTFTTGGQSADHNHGSPIGGYLYRFGQFVAGPFGDTGPGPGALTNATGAASTAGASNDHTHSGTTANQGSGTVHQNTQPSIVVNKIMRAL